MTFFEIVARRIKLLRKKFVFFLDFLGYEVWDTGVGHLCKETARVVVSMSHKHFKRAQVSNICASGLSIQAFAPVYTDVAHICVPRKIVFHTHRRVADVLLSLPISIKIFSTII